MPGLELMGKIGLDGKAFEAELHKVRHLTMGVAEGVTEALKRAVLTGVGVATVEEAMRKTVETVDELADSSQRLAIAPEQLQILKRAAKEAGTDLEKLAEAFEKIDVARQKALIPGKEGVAARRAFGAIGVTGDMLRTQTAAQLFMGPMSAAARNTNPEQLGIVFRELRIKGFGPVIATLQTNFDELGKHMKEVGAIMDSETIAKIKTLGEELSIVGLIITAKLGPILLKLTDVIMHVVAGLSATWAYIKSYFSDKTSNEAMHRWMNMTPGFGGYTKEQLEDLKKNGPPKFTSAEQNKAANETAKQAGVSKIKEWDDFFADIQSKFEALRKRLESPTAPDFSKSMLPEKLSAKALLTPTDNLVKVGNFLGGKGVGLEHRKVDLLQQIANNTRFAWKPVGNPKLHSYELSPVSYPHR